MRPSRFMRYHIPSPIAALFIAVAAIAALLWTDAVPRAEGLMGLAWRNTDFSKSAIDLDEVLSGGPPKDGIPAIDRPRFVGVEVARAWLNPKEPVIALVINDQARAYPLQILTYHEIVNDVLGDTPVSVTFCPLCNSAIVFERRVKGRTLDFGATGKLRISNLIMYDRQTESWWQQFTGEAIVGEMTGTELKTRPATIISFKKFTTLHPQGDVLSRETGHVRPYGNNPYRGYDQIDNNPFLLQDPADPRLAPMERVLAVEVDGMRRLYPFSALEKNPVINGMLAKTPVAILSHPDAVSALDSSVIRHSKTVLSAAAFKRNLEGRILTFHEKEGTILDRETGSRWSLLGEATAGPLKGKTLKQVDGGVHFAFAWLAFHPEAEIFKNPG